MVSRPDGEGLVGSGEHLLGSIGRAGKPKRRVLGKDDLPLGRDTEDAGEGHDAEPRKLVVLLAYLDALVILGSEGQDPRGLGVVPPGELVRVEAATQLRVVPGVDESVASAVSAEGIEARKAGRAVEPRAVGENPAAVLRSAPRERVVEAGGRGRIEGIVIIEHVLLVENDCVKPRNAREHAVDSRGLAHVPAREIDSSHARIARKDVGEVGDRTRVPGGKGVVVRQAGVTAKEPGDRRGAGGVPPVDVADCRQARVVGEHQREIGRAADIHELAVEGSEVRVVRKPTRRVEEIRIALGVDGVHVGAAGDGGPGELGGSLGDVSVTAVVGTNRQNVSALVIAPPGIEIGEAPTEVGTVPVEREVRAVSGTNLRVDRRQARGGIERVLVEPLDGARIAKPGVGGQVPASVVIVSGADVGKSRPDDGGRAECNRVEERCIVEHVGEVRRGGHVPTGEVDHAQRIGVIEEMGEGCHVRDIPVADGAGISERVGIVEERGHVDDV